MNRHEFSMLVIDLFLAMEADGLQPFFDYVKRSNEEQKRLYLQGLSKCDGVVKHSQHQLGRAVDIYFEDMGKATDAEILARHIKYHSWWEFHGGQPMLDWDQGHYEVK